MRLHPMDGLDHVGRDFYRSCMQRLQQAQIPFLVGGAYSLERHTGVVRHTKDFDIFLKRDDIGRALQVLTEAGYACDLPFPHWIGKAFFGEYFMDLLFSSGNGLCPVDDEWFSNAVDNIVLDLPVQCCPVEETLWQKCFILERDRCDSADVAHLLRMCAERIDWKRLVRRFDKHWRVLYAHLMLFGFIYPTERALIPSWVMRQFSQQLAKEVETPEADQPSGVINIANENRNKSLAANNGYSTSDKSQNGQGRLCQGTFISATQYLRDVDLEGFRDARLKPEGPISHEDLVKWTANFVKP